MSAEPPPLAAHVTLDLRDGVGREIRETAVLEVAPEQFHGIQLGRVRRKPDNVPARMSRQPRRDQVVLVGAATVPDEDDGTAHVAREMAEKAQHLRASDVQPRVQRHGEGELAPSGRHDQRANPGHLFMRAGAHGQRGRDAARRPRAPEHQQHQEPGLIEADQVAAAAREFFLPGASPAGSTRARGDRRALWRVAGAAAD